MIRTNELQQKWASWYMFRYQQSIQDTKHMLTGYYKLTLRLLINSAKNSVLTVAIESDGRIDGLAKSVAHTSRVRVLACDAPRVTKQKVNLEKLYDLRCRRGDRVKSRAPPSREEGGV